MNQIAEGGALIYQSVAQEVLASVLALLESQEHGLHHILHIHKGDVLTLIAHGEITVALDALGHDEVILFARTIHTRRP